MQGSTITIGNDFASFFHHSLPFVVIVLTFLDTYLLKYKSADNAFSELSVK